MSDQQGEEHKVLEAVAEDVSAPDSVAEAIPATDTVTEDIPVPETVAEESPAPEAVAEEIPTPEAASVGVSAPEAVAEEIPAPEAVDEAIPAPEAVSVGVLVPEAVAEAIPAPEAVAEEVLVPEAVAEEIPAPEAVAEEVPAPEAAEEEILVPEAVAEEIVRTSDEENPPPPVLLYIPLQKLAKNQMAFFHFDLRVYLGLSGNSFTIGYVYHLREPNPLRRLMVTIARIAHTDAEFYLSYFSRYRMRESIDTDADVIKALLIHGIFQADPIVSHVKLVVIAEFKEKFAENVLNNRITSRMFNLPPNTSDVNAPNLHDGHVFLSVIKNMLPDIDCLRCVDFSFVRALLIYYESESASRNPPAAPEDTRAPQPPANVEPSRIDQAQDVSAPETLQVDTRGLSANQRRKLKNQMKLEQWIDKKREEVMKSSVDIEKGESKVGSAQATSPELPKQSAPSGKTVSTRRPQDDIPGPSNRPPLSSDEESDDVLESERILKSFMDADDSGSIEEMNSLQKAIHESIVRTQQAVDEEIAAGRLFETRRTPPPVPPRGVRPTGPAHLSKWQPGSPVHLRNLRKQDNPYLQAASSMPRKDVPLIVNAEPMTVPAAEILGKQPWEKKSEHAVLVVDSKDKRVYDKPKQSVKSDEEEENTSGIVTGSISMTPAGNISNNPFSPPEEEFEDEGFMHTRTGDNSDAEKPETAPPPKRSKNQKKKDRKQRKRQRLESQKSHDDLDEKETELEKVKRELDEHKKMLRTVQVQQEATEFTKDELEKTKKILEKRQSDIEMQGEKSVEAPVQVEEMPQEHLEPERRLEDLEREHRESVEASVEPERETEEQPEEPEVTPQPEEPEVTPAVSEDKPEEMSDQLAMESEETEEREGGRSEEPELKPEESAVKPEESGCELEEKSEVKTEEILDEPEVKSEESQDKIEGKSEEKLDEPVVESEVSEDKPKEPEVESENKPKEKSEKSNEESDVKSEESGLKPEEKLEEPEVKSDEALEKAEEKSEPETKSEGSEDSSGDKWYDAMGKSSESEKDTEEPERKADEPEEKSEKGAS